MKIQLNHIVLLLVVMTFAASCQNPKQGIAGKYKKRIIASLPEKPTVTPKRERRILIISRCEGFVHGSIPYGRFMLEQMGRKTGAFIADFSEGYECFTADHLKKYDAIVFNNTTNLNPTDEQRDAILEFIRSGKGIIGIHAATDNFRNWHEGVCMMGGCFNGHPWGANGTWAFKLDDADHPINQVFNKKGFWHKDEIYQYHPDHYQGEENLRILISLDMTKNRNIEALVNQRKKGAPRLTATEKAKRTELAKLRKVPVSWIRDFGDGRLFYTNFGHRNETFWNTKINRHILDGIQFALGDLSADAAPTHHAKDLNIALAPPKP